MALETWIFVAIHGSVIAMNFLLQFRDPRLEEREIARGWGTKRLQFKVDWIYGHMEASEALKVLAHAHTAITFWQWTFICVNSPPLFGRSAERKKQKIDNNSRGLGSRRKISCLVSAFRRESCGALRRRRRGERSGRSISHRDIQQLSCFNIHFCCRREGLILMFISAIFHSLEPDARFVSVAEREFSIVFPPFSRWLLKIASVCAIWYRKVLLNGFRFGEGGFSVHGWRHREATQVLRADFLGFHKVSSYFGSKIPQILSRDEPSDRMM